MSEIYLSKNTSKVLKSLSNKKDNKFGGKDIPEDEYKNIQGEIEELKDASLIRITFPSQPNQIENRVYRIRITNDGKNYFNKQRRYQFKYWAPCLIGWFLSILTIIISIINLYRQFIVISN